MVLMKRKHDWRNDRKGEVLEDIVKYELKVRQKEMNRDRSWTQYPKYEEEVAD